MKNSYSRSRKTGGRKVKFVILWTLYFCVPFTAEAQDREAVWVEYPVSGAVLGQGYNLLDGRPTYGSCVNFIPVQDPAQVVQYKFEHVKSQTEVFSSTDISASGSLKMALVTASAKLSFLSEEKFDLKTEKFLLTASVTNSALYAAPSLGFKKGLKVPSPALSSKDLASLNDEFNKKYITYTQIEFKDDPGNSEENVDKCGHGFVGAIEGGASVDAFLTFTKSDAEALSNVKASLQADIGGIFKVSGSLKQKQTSKNAQENASASVFKTGGSEGAFAFDIQTLKESLKSLPMDAARNPKPMRMRIVPYGLLNKVKFGKDSLTAAKLKEGVSAFFLLKDVFQKTEAVINERFNYNKKVEAVGVKVPIPIYEQDQIDKYVALNNQSLNKMHALKNLLSTCFEKLKNENKSFGEPKGLGADGAAAPALVPVGQRIEAFLKGLKDKKDDCMRLGGRTTLLDQLIDDAIKLTAMEIKNRPIYWLELDEETKFEIEGFIDGFPLPVDFTAKSADVIISYNKNYRVFQLIRAICKRKIENPLCSVDFKSFSTDASLDWNQANINFTQIKNELK